MGEVMYVFTKDQSVTVVDCTFGPWTPFGYNASSGVISVLPPQPSGIQPWLNYNERVIT